MKVAIITGASSGMGRYFALYCKRFFKDIDEIWLVGRNIKRLSLVNKKLNNDAVIFPIDLTTDDGLNLFSDELRRKKPEIELLVNSAGMGIIGRFEALNCEDIHNMISINCEALTKVISICLEYMGNNSNIINLASAAAFVPQPEFQVYAASKSYVKSLSAALSKEFRENGITVTAVCPGCVNTPFFNVAQKYSSIKSYKKLFMAKDKDVVIKAYRDAKKGKMYSVYGFFMQLFQIVCKLIPSKILMLFM